MTAKLPQHMILRKGVITYKRRVPEHLRDRPPFNGKDVYQVSLGVRTTPEARRVIAERGIDSFFQDHVAQADANDERIPLTNEIVVGITNEEYNRGVANLYASRLSEPEEVRDLRDSLAAQNVGQMNHLKTATRARAILKAEQEDIRLSIATSLANRRKLQNDPDSVQRIADALFEAEIAELGARVTFASGQPVAPTPHFALLPSEAVKPAKAYWPFAKMAEEAIAKSKKGESWNHKVRVATELFAQYAKDTPIHKIERSTVKTFLRDVREAPDRMTLRFPGLALRTAISANAERDKPYSTVSPNTISTNYFAPVRWVFAHALSEDYIESTPCHDIRIEGASKAKGKSRGVPFEVDELNAFFSLPTFTGCRSADRPNQPGEYRFNDHRKWVPLLMLFSGARPSEIAQLTLKDIRHEHRYPHISILTDFDPSDPYDQENIVSFKTANARRILPIHPTLIQLGFLKFVQDASLTENNRLFPEWKKSNDPRKLYTSATWIRNTNDRMIPSVVNRYPKPTLYSFRHTWKTLMATHEVSSQYQNQIMGHAQTGMDAFYLGSLGIDALYRAVESLSYEGLDLSHLALNISAESKS